MEDDPIYYRKLADLIKETIEEYYLKRISEAEFLKKAKEYEDKFLFGRSEDAPKELANNDAALAFYNFSKSVYASTELLKTPFHIEAALTIDQTVKDKIYLNGNKLIDWHENDDIKGKIIIALGDGLYELLKKYSVDVDWNTIDLLVEDCLKVSIRKYQ